MERDFEREFRELKQNEVPDLWNRIEAGLSKRENVALVSEKAVVMDDAPGTGNEYFIKKDFERENIRKPFAWRKWGTLIAACVCVVIILPAFSLLIRDKSYSGSGSDTAANTTEAAAEDNAAMDTAAAEDNAAMDTATAENAECGFAADEAAAAEEVMQENGMDGGAGAADAGGAEAAVATNEAADTSSNAASENAAPMDAAAENKTADIAAGNTQTQEADRADALEKEEEKAAWDGLADGQILEEAVIRIQKAETADGETLYQAAVEQADADNLLESGTQIALVCNGDTEYELLRGPRGEKVLNEQEMYRVTLCYDAENGRFTVLKAGSWEG